MKSRNYAAFIGDLQRYRPLIVVVLSLLILLPSLDQMVTQGLSMLVVLFRLAESMFFISVVVSLVFSVLRHYAKVQARAEQRDESENEAHAQ